MCRQLALVADWRAVLECTKTECNYCLQITAAA